MCTDLPLLIVNWAEAAEDPSDNMFTDTDNSAYQMVNSREDFSKFIKKNVISDDFERVQDNRKIRAHRDELIKRHLFKIDGKRSLAVADFIKKSISDFHNKSQDAYPITEDEHNANTVKN